MKNEKFKQRHDKIQKEMILGLLNKEFECRLEYQSIDYEEFDKKFIYKKNRNLEIKILLKNLSKALEYLSEAKEQINKLYGKTNYYERGHNEIEFEYEIWNEFQKLNGWFGKKYNLLKKLYWKIKEENDEQSN